MFLLQTFSTNTNNPNRHRWKNNIRMDLREIGWEGVDRMQLAQGRDQ
jgi:hypothetical protein